MASSPIPLTPLFTILATFLLLTTPRILTHAATTAAPSPSPRPLDITAILQKGQQYTTLLRLLKDTHIGQQIQSQLDHSTDGLTLLAPTDNAFNNLKPGTLNHLTSQDQVALVLYHVLPKYYTPETFETASNPVRTQASGNNGEYTVNVTSTSNQVNVSTGVVETQLNNELYSEFPLAVFSLDKVLLPYDLFGPKPPASSKAPGSAKEKPTKTPTDSSAGGPSSEDVTSPSAASFEGRRVGWSLVVGAALMILGILS